MSSSPSLSSRASTRSSSGTIPDTPTAFAKNARNKTGQKKTDLQNSLTRELEKKFSDRHVLFVAQRRILPRPKRSVNSRSNQTQKRPRSRTLTAVHDAILTDLVYPVEVVGKRIRTKEDGSKTIKVILDEKERGGVDHRLDAYGEVYRRLTGRSVVFEFPQSGSSDY